MKKVIAGVCVAILITSMIICCVLKLWTSRPAMAVIEIYLLMKVPNSEYMIITTDDGKREVIHSVKDIENKIRDLGLSAPLENYFVLGDLQSFGLEMRDCFQHLTKRTISLGGRTNFVNRLLIAPADQCVFITSINADGRCKWFTVDHSNQTVAWDHGSTAKILSELQKFRDPRICLGSRVKMQEGMLSYFKGFRIYSALEFPNCDSPFLQYPNKENGELRMQVAPADPFIQEK